MGNRLFKTCDGCGAVVEFTKHPSEATCRPCVRKQEKERQRRVWAELKRSVLTEEQKLKTRLDRYGLTLEQYQSLLDRSKGRCEICRCDKPLNIDHDHETGVVRGLLCTGCNTGLGALGDTVTALERALAYLKSETPY